MKRRRHRLPLRARLAVRLLTWGHDKWHKNPDRPDPKCYLCQAEARHREQDELLRKAEAVRKASDA